MAEDERKRLAYSIADLYAQMNGRAEPMEMDIAFSRLVMDLVTDYIIRQRTP